MSALYHFLYFECLSVLLLRLLLAKKDSFFPVNDSILFEDVFTTLWMKEVDPDSIILDHSITFSGFQNIFPVKTARSPELA